MTLNTIWSKNMSETQSGTMKRCYSLVIFIENYGIAVYKGVKMKQ